MEIFYAKNKGPQRFSQARLLFLLLLFTISISFIYSFGKKEQTAEPPKKTPEAQTQQASSIDPAPKRSYAGVIDAFEFPDGMDWLNVKEPLKFSNLRGKIVLLDFWTYGCINCMHNIPYIKHLQEEYPNELVVIGIHSAKFANEGKVSILRNIILRYGITHPVVNDPGFVLWQMWGPQAWPTLVLVDPAGKVSAATMGKGFYPHFKEIVQSLKEEFAAKGQLDTGPWKNLLLRPETRKLSLLSFQGKMRVDPSGNRLFVADSGNHRILHVDADTGSVLTRIGSGAPGFRDGTFDTAQFRNPQGMAVSPDGRVVYVADTGNHALRKIDLKAGRVTTLAGIGKQSEEYPPSAGVGPNLPLSSPWDVELSGNILYIAVAGRHQVWTMDLLSQRLSPLAGSGAEGFADGPAKEAELPQPSSISLYPNGRLYFADSEGSSIRFIELKERKVVTLAGAGNSLFDFGAVDAAGKQARFQHPL